jgi:hypothetical protein
MISAVYSMTRRSLSIAEAIEIYLFMQTIVSTFANNYNFVNGYNG